MPNRETVQTLVNQVETGQIIDAFNRFYAEDVVMQENSNPPTVGKEANLAREQAFVAGVKEVHENRATSVLVDGDKSVIAWVLDFTNTEGTRLRIDQVTHQTWQGDQIVSERFYYDSASVVQAN
jgi:ketosteroid isomerase-like protein